MDLSIIHYVVICKYRLIKVFGHPMVLSEGWYHGMSAELLLRKREENLRFFVRSRTKIYRKQTLSWKV